MNKTVGLCFSGMHRVVGGEVGVSKSTTRVATGFAELRPLPITGPVSAFAKDCHPAPGHWSLPGS